MPKDRKKRGAKQPVEPYSSKKQNQATVDVEPEESDDKLSCKKCLKCVDNVIQCERCEHWYCSKCTGLSSAVMEIIYLYKQLHWFCEACDKVAIDAILEPTGKEDSSVSKHQDLVVDIVTQIGEVIKEANECIKKTLSETLQGSVFSGLAEDAVMEANNASNTSSNTSHSYGKTTSDVINTFLDEEKERSKRRLNVILHNVEESSADDGQTRKEQDISTASSVFDKYMGVKPSILNAYRIGKKRNPGPGIRPRLLKLTLASEQDKALLLRNCTKLRNKDNPEDVKKVYVTPDLTPREQQKNKALRTQLAEMNKDEKKYWIKNGKIVQRVN